MQNVKNLYGKERTREFRKFDLRQPPYRHRYHFYVSITNIFFDNKPYILLFNAWGQLVFFLSSSLVHFFCVPCAKSKTLFYFPTHVFAAVLTLFWSDVLTLLPSLVLLAHLTIEFSREIGDVVKLFPRLEIPNNFISSNSFVFHKWKGYLVAVLCLRN